MFNFHRVECQTSSVQTRHHSYHNRFNVIGSQGRIVFLTTCKNSRSRRVFICSRRNLAAAFPVKHFMTRWIASSWSEWRIDNPWWCTTSYRSHLVQLPKRFDFMSVAFDYLVRFLDQTGEIVFGTVPEYRPPERLVGTSVSLLSGAPFSGLEPTAQERIVRKVCSSNTRNISIFDDGLSNGICMQVLCSLESTPILAMHRCELC